MGSRIGPGWAAAALAAVALGAAGCGHGERAIISAPTPATPAPAAGTPNEIDLPVPAGTEAGRLVAMQSGCLACHTLGTNGNAGPGGDLTHVGASLDRAAIEAALRRPTAPMPSFAALPRRKLAALVDYLAALD